jgi:hypothetical protein
MSQGETSWRDLKEPPRHRCQINGAVMPNNRNELAGTIGNIVHRSVAAEHRRESIV